MINIRVNSKRMRQTLQKLNTYADEELGKVSENLLRRIVTGEGSEDLPSSQGLKGLALQHAPKPEKIESDISKLKLVLLTQKGSKRKKLVRMNEVNKFKALKERIKAIGYTSRTLALRWREAVAGRSGIVDGELSRDHTTTIETKGQMQRATFVSIHKGLKALDNKHNIVATEVMKAKADIVPYFRNTIIRGIRNLVK